MEVHEIETAITEMEGAFEAIQQPRSDFQIERFVVGEKDTEPAAYAQCVLELQIKYDAIRRGILQRRKLELERAAFLKQGGALNQIEADLKSVDIDELDRAMIGARREFECLYRIWQAFPKRYTYEELQAAQTDYWRHRLVRQAEQDAASTGRIGVGNLDALRQIGLAPTSHNGQLMFVPMPTRQPLLEVPLPPDALPNATP